MVGFQGKYWNRNQQKIVKEYMVKNTVMTGSGNIKNNKQIANMEIKIKKKII